MRPQDNGSREVADGTSERRAVVNQEVLTMMKRYCTIVHLGRFFNSCQIKEYVKTVEIYPNNFNLEYFVRAWDHRDVEPLTSSLSVRTMAIFSTGRSAGLTINSLWSYMTQTAVATFTKPSASVSISKRWETHGSMSLVPGRDGLPVQLLPAIHPFCTFPFPSPSGGKNEDLGCVDNRRARDEWFGRSDRGF